MLPAERTRQSVRLSHVDDITVISIFLKYGVAAFDKSPQASVHFLKRVSVTVTLLT
jgi:hypothetical protein